MCTHSHTGISIHLFLSGSLWEVRQREARATVDAVGSRVEFCSPSCTHPVKAILLQQCSSPKMETMSTQPYKGTISIATITTFILVRASLYVQTIKTFYLGPMMVDWRHCTIPVLFPFSMSHTKGILLCSLSTMCQRMLGQIELCRQSKEKQKMLLTIEINALS